VLLLCLLRIQIVLDCMLADDLSAVYVWQSTKTSDDDLRVTHMQVRLQHRDLVSIQLKDGIILKLRGRNKVGTPPCMFYLIWPAESASSDCCALLYVLFVQMYSV